MDIWARLSIYESTDLVRELFQRRHGRELNAEKAREIVSAIAQGREYFSSASEAGLLVRPLLQYYGVLSLCRGLVLLLSQNLRETSLPQAHGLSAVSWESRLATSAWRPADLEVKVTGGTFFSMLENTHNSEFSTVFTAPYPNNLMFLQAWPVAGLNGARLTFQQVLSRISELRDVYERSLANARRIIVPSFLPSRQRRRRILISLMGGTDCPLNSN